MKFSQIRVEMDQPECYVIVCFHDDFWGHRFYGPDGRKTQQASQRSTNWMRGRGWSSNAATAKSQFVGAYPIYKFLPLDLRKRIVEAIDILEKRLTSSRRAAERQDRSEEPGTVRRVAPELVKT